MLSRQHQYCHFCLYLYLFLLLMQGPFSLYLLIVHDNSHDYFSQVPLLKVSQKYLEMYSFKLEVEQNLC